VNLTNVGLSLAEGSSFQASKLKNFSGSTVTLTPSRQFKTGGLTNINNSYFAVQDGAVWGTGTGDVAADAYDTRGIMPNPPDQVDYYSEILQATGSGSVLDLSSVQSINAGFDDGRWYDYNIHRISAKLGGTVNLSGVKTLTAPVRYEDRLDFLTSGGGSINLSGLTTITSAGSGRVRFDLQDAGSASLGSLVSGAQVEFNLGEGCKLSLPSLVTHNGGSYTVPAGASVTAGEMVNLTNVGLSLAEGSSFQASKLKNFSGSTVTLTPGQQFKTGGLMNINNSYLAVQDAAVWGTGTGDVAANVYDTRGIVPDPQDRVEYYSEVLQATGSGSVLDLSSVQSINAGFDDGRSYDYNIHRISAKLGGTINLSGVTTVVGPVRSEDGLDFFVASGGTIDLSHLQGVSRNVRFDIQTDGKLILGNIAVSNNTTFNVANITSSLDVTGSLFLDATSQLAVAAGAEVHVGDDLWFAYTDENRLGLASSILHMNGSGPQYLEAGGTDLGIGGSTAGNFGIGRLVIGQEDQPTTVMLMDLFDNGNRGEGKPEALYLYGLGGVDGLELLGGSKLVLDGINVYAKQRGEWVHLNSLFGPDVKQISFAGGIVTVPEPSSFALLAVAAVTLLAVRRRRRA
ncbi:MAG: PEP-CTERM sorting domain-containing protein, partial [Pirellulales bacterium]